MTKRDSSIFLPRAIVKWGGIENWISGDRSRMNSCQKYWASYNTSMPSAICGWIGKRLAKSGQCSVTNFNRIIRRAANRYSGAPERTYLCQMIDGYGRVILVNDMPAASVRFWPVNEACEAATDEAQQCNTPHSDMRTRMLWRDGKYTELKSCRWCGEPVDFKEHWKQHDGSVRCNRRDCRRMEYLQHKPQSRGGIDLTPRQRQGLSYEAWNTQKVINYLALVAKEQKRGRKSNHDVR